MYKFAMKKTASSRVYLDSQKNSASSYRICRVSYSQPNLLVSRISQMGKLFALCKLIYKTKKYWFWMRRYCICGAIKKRRNQSCNLEVQKSENTGDCRKVQSKNISKGSFAGCCWNGVSKSRSGDSKLEANGLHPRPKGVVLQRQSYQNVAPDQSGTI